MKIFNYKLISFIAFFLIVFSLFSLDLITKMEAQKSFMLNYSPSDIQQYMATSKNIFTVGSDKNWIDFSLTYVRNTGAAWGLLGNMNENYRPYFFNAVTIIAMILIIIFFRQTPRTKLLARLGMIFIFSGACGNFFDRFVFHYVIDWIHFRWLILGWYYDFPVFNIADSCVTTGVGLLLIDMILSERTRNKNGTTTISEKLNK